MQAGMDLTGMSPFRNAHYTPSVPVQHGMYGQVPGVQNGYLDDAGQVSGLPPGQAPSCHDGLQHAAGLSVALADQSGILGVF